jgi:hypothetical protein
MKTLFAMTLLVPLLALAQPPVEVLNPDVTQETVAATICNPTKVHGKNYVRAARPSTSYTNGIKVKLMRDQGIDVGRAHEFELDHKLPIELGGHPRNQVNLWLQAWDGTDGAHAKDKLENRLHRMVCAGKMPLTEAQACIWDDWQACAAKYRGR